MRSGNSGGSGLGAEEEVDSNTEKRKNRDWEVFERLEGEPGNSK
jgi:hypothetical protein